MKINRPKSEWKTQNRNCEEENMMDGLVDQPNSKV